MQFRFGFAFSVFVFVAAGCGGGGGVPAVPPSSSGGTSGALSVDGYHATFTQYPLPSGAQNPQDIVVGPNGAVWFPVSTGVGEATNAGAVNVYLDKAYSNYGVGITSAGGMLWVSAARVTESLERDILSLTPAGSFSSIPFDESGSNLDGAIPGAFTSYAGNVYFAFYGNFESGIGSIPAGSSKYGFLGMPPFDSYDFGELTTGTDGSIFATGPVSAMQSYDELYHCPANGSACTITNLSSQNEGLGVYGIARGADGNLWITESRANAIAKVSTSGVVLDTYPVPTKASAPTNIVSAPDGTLWFTEYQGDKLGRITTTGTITEYPIPSPDAGPWGITTCPTQCENAHGRLWFTERTANVVARFEY